MINEEELQQEGLSKRIEKAQKSLIRVLRKIKAKESDPNSSISFTNETELLVLLKDLYELKEVARKKPSLEISQKVLRIYNTQIKPLLKTLDSALKNWNSSHIHKVPNGVEELTNAPIREEYFNY